MLHLAVCDDRMEDRKKLCRLLNEYGQYNNLELTVDQWSTGEDFLLSFAPGRYQLVFLDIYMKQINGVETARTIREQDEDCAIVFVTTSPEHAVEGFSVNALHYLLKPLTAAQLDTVFQRLTRLQKKEPAYITVRSQRLEVRCNVDEIIFAEIYDKLCLIHTKTNTIQTYTPLDEIERQVPVNLFLRCHRSYLVNMSYITRMEDTQFTVHDQHLIPIRKNDRQTLKQRYLDYLFATTRSSDAEHYD